MGHKHTVSLAVAVLLSAMLACNAPGAEAPDLTATFAVALTQAFGTAQASLSTPGPIVITSTPSGGASPTTAPTETTGPRECVDSAKFLADVTIPDGTVFNTPTTFTKTWRLQNTGTCTWDSTYILKFVGGDKLEGPEAVALPGEVRPGDSVDISVTLRSPARPATYTGKWRLTNAKGEGFGTNGAPITVVIVVPATPAPSFTPAPPTATSTDTATATATITSTPIPLGGLASQYAGSWYNNDPATNGITQLNIGAASATQITVSGWLRCAPTDCVWGTGSGTISGSSVTINNFSLASNVTVTLSLLAPGALHAVYNNFVYEFHLGPLASDWNGTWTNLNPATTNITKIIILANGNQIGLNPFVKCTPTDCNWGTQSFAYTNPLTTVGFPHNLSITFVRANEMKVVDNTNGVTESFKR
jgi:hypothetical protein